MTRHAVTRQAVFAAVLLLIAGCSAVASQPTIPPVESVVPSASASATPLDSHPPESSYPPGCPTKQPAALPAGQTRTVTISTNKGQIVIKVEGALSPIAVGNFVALADCGYYDGVIFHRIVPDFVLQGGDGSFGREPNVNLDYVGFGGAPYTIQDEPVTSTYTRGTVAMARTSQPNSVTSQFFIVLSDAAGSALGGSDADNYQIIGHVTSGMSTVDAIAAMPNSGDPDYIATSPVAMDKVTVTNP
jgi:peptidyl-prolyl cis-trans isomerase B (cyclophilin B)